MVVGTLVFAIEALYYFVARLLHYQTYRITGSLGLAALLFSSHSISPATQRGALHRDAEPQQSNRPPPDEHKNRSGHDANDFVAERG
jgi:hypothetical protein